MRNGIRKLFLLLGICLCAASGLWAQANKGAQPSQITPIAPSSPAIIQPAAAAQPAAVAPAAPAVGYVDGSLLFLDIGVTSGYGLGVKAPIIGRSVGLNFVITDNLAIGFSSTTAGATSYDLLRLGYSFMPLLGIEIYVGTDGSTAGGVGFFMRLKNSTTNAGVCSSLKLRLGYFCDTTAGLTSGNVVLGLGTSVGI